MKYRSTPPRRGFVGAAAVLLSLAAAPQVTHAYSTPAAFAEPPQNGGGGERYFTGSPAEGYDCSVCHEDNADQAHYPIAVTGLPEGGYNLAERREVVISWAQFSALRRQRIPDPTTPMPADFDPPAMGLLAEFVAESGKASGAVEIVVDGAPDEARCERTRPNLEPKVATQLYQVRAGVAPIRIRPDSTGKLRCEANQLGQRCLVALDDCGAEQVRLIWQAPETWQGPIWFAASAVHTDAINGYFDRDATSAVALPVLPADSAQAGYQEVLTGGCSSTGNPGHAAALGLPLLTLLGMRRRRPRGGKS